jgi:hypothetical protein
VRRPETGWFSQPDYEWLAQAFCVSFVRGLDSVEMLRRMGAHPAAVRPLTLLAADGLQMSLDAGYPQVVLAAELGDWSVAIEANGFEGTRPEVLRVLSQGAEAVSVFCNINAVGRFNHVADGELLTGFEPLFPDRRQGRDPDRLLPWMRESAWTRRPARTGHGHRPRGGAGPGGSDNRRTPGRGAVVR